MCDAKTFDRLFNLKNYLLVMEDTPKRKPITTLQSVVAVIAVAVAITAFICALYWARSTNTTDKFGGGLNWTDQVFNWHVVCMVSFVACMSMALVSFRVLPLGKPINKALHITWHCCALFCLIMGLIAVFKSHNTKVAGIKANLYSLHSWVGLAVVLLFGQNYCMGLIMYGTGYMPQWMKEAYMPYHRFLGECSYFVALAAVESGLMEKNTFSGCNYTVGQKDYNPAENYLDIPAGCRLTNGIGMLILTLALCVCFVISDLFRKKEADLNTSLLSDGKL